MPTTTRPDAPAAETEGRVRPAPASIGRRVRLELATIPSLAGPLILAQMGWMMLGLVDTFMVGHLGPRPLAAVALGDLWIVGTLLVAMGVMLGLDPIVSQAHGAGDGRRAAHALQRGVVLALLLSVPLAVLWLATGAALRLAGQDPALAAEADRFVGVQVFSIAPFLVFVALRQYLQGRTIMMPTLIVIVAGNVVNFVLDWLLIFGRLGFPELGVRGSGIATGVTRVVMLALLLALVRWYRLHEGAWVPWTREIFDLRRLREILGHGIPTGIQLGLEIWAFATTSLFAGWLGAEALAAHTIVLKLASFSYMVPLGISIAAATRVGNLIGARDRAGARCAAWVAIGLGGGVMTVFALLLVTLRTVLPALFLAPGQEAVVALAATIMPIAALFQFFDGTQAVGCGVLRGLGNTRPAALFNLVGFYALALPLALGLGFERPWGPFRGAGWGLPGLWTGLAAGLFAVAALLVLFLWRGATPLSERVAD